MTKFSAKIERYEEGIWKQNLGLDNNNNDNFAQEDFDNITTRKSVQVAIAEFSSKNSGGLRRKFTTTQECFRDEFLNKSISNGSKNDIWSV